MSGVTLADTVAVSVHGTTGALDLVVPTGATVGDLAVEFAAQSRLPSPPRLLTITGQELPPGQRLHAVGVRSGDVLVAPPVGGTPERLEVAAGSDPSPVIETGPTQHLPMRGGASLGSTSGSWLALGWFAFAASLAVIAGFLGAHTNDDSLRQATAAVLGFAAVCGLLPLGRYVDQRAAASPAFAAAAAYVVVYQPGEDRYPLVIGVAALTAAVAGGVARSTTPGPTEPHDVWIVSGLSLFLVSGLCVLCGWGPEVAWGFFIVIAMMAARFVPAWAVDVPDQMLIDLERLAINAWSARDQTTGRRTRTLIPMPLIEHLLGQGRHTVTAASAAIFGVMLISVPQLLATTHYDTQQRGAQVLLFFSGAALLLAARSYRHALARLLLRSSGLYAWVWLTADLLVDTSSRVHWYVVLVSVLLAAVVAAAAIATGRGWRSVWWARRAEVAEGMSGAFALAALVASSGLFAQLWQMRQ